MLGAGSGFVITIAEELKRYPVFADCEFRLMDPSPERLAAAEKYCRDILADADYPVHIKTTTDMRMALAGSNYVITSCEKNRYPNWAMDIKIPEKHGVFQIKGENGGPGGLIHGLRNIEMFKNILSAMEELCPDAWLMNFTNPMSILCTYFNKYSRIRSMGFCHQVHGSFGLIAELLGFEPGELEVIAGGINHLSWLFDIRRRNSAQSYMAEFLSAVRNSQYWHKHFPNIPGQTFTLEVLEAFEMYPVGYDDHIIEYLPFFWPRELWNQYGFTSLGDTYEKRSLEKHKTLEKTHLLGAEYEKIPFPANPAHPYYAEKPCQAIWALETNTPTYLDALVIPNNGAIGNLTADAIVDIPSLIVGGQARSVYVGELPPGPLEICRRQIALHEMIAQAAHEGNESLIIQALSLDPYVHGLNRARNIWHDYKQVYTNDLPSFT